MKERSLLFAAAMARAALADIKTQTRRVCKPQPIADGRFVGGHYLPATKRQPGQEISVEAPYVHIACPYGQPGDRMWGRETFYAWGRWETRYSAKKRRDEWHFIDMTLECGKAYLYPATDPQPQPMGGEKHRCGVTPTWWKRPAIFMPKVASRITLEITSVRVERLQAISFADAAAEGLQYTSERLDRWSADGNTWAATPQNAYRALWEQINGPDSWTANPWVWAITFKRLP
jgi:hypothetical protein